MDTSLFVFSPVYIVFAIPISLLIAAELLRSTIASRRPHQHRHHQHDHSQPHDHHQSHHRRHQHHDHHRPHAA